MIKIRINFTILINWIPFLLNKFIFMRVALAIMSQMWASTWTALGYAIQKSAHEQARKQGMSILKQFRWWLGLVIMQIEEIILIK